MIEQKQPQSNYEERFQFKLMANDNIICQRYFKINKFNEESMISVGFKDIVDLCVRMIDEDLKSKTRIYLAAISPTFLKTEQELKEYLNTPRGGGWAAKTDIYKYSDYLQIGDSFYLTSENKELVWDGSTFIEPNVFYKTDYSEFSSPVDNNYPVVFKFTVYDNNKEVITKIWDGNVYPKFVRNSVDLSNKRNRFDGDNKAFEMAIVSLLNEGKSDLVYTMIRTICDYCSSFETKYKTKFKFGKTVYVNDKEKRMEETVPRKYFDPNHRINVEYLNK